jgi:curved DNA-binding protein CbpA
LDNIESFPIGENNVTEMRNPYEILNVPETATESELKKAYRELAAKHHPDKHANDPNEARKMLDINWARDELSSPEKRKATDERLRKIREAVRLFQVTRAQPTPTYPIRPIYSPPVQVNHQRKEPSWGAILFGLGLAALWAGSGSNSKWDPNVQRYRGRDGRFVS